MHASFAFTFVLLHSLLCLCNSGIVVKDNEIPSNNGCEIGNKVYKVGEQWSNLGECMLFTCYEAGAYEAVTCAAVRFRENSGCYETDIDNKKLYPDCCPKVICPQRRE